MHSSDTVQLLEFWFLLQYLLKRNAYAIHPIFQTETLILYAQTA